jgi:hypothetical protein
MKNLKNIFLVIIFTSLLFACDKEDGVEVPNMSDQEAAELVASSLISDISNVTIDLGSTGYRAENPNSGGRTSETLQCGETVTETYSKSHDGEFIDFNFEATYSNTLSCFFNVPVHLDAELSSTSTTESPGLLTEGSLNGTTTLGLDNENIGNYLLNANLKKVAQVTAKRGEQNSFNTNTDITIKDLSLSTAYLLELLGGQTLSTEFIAGGTATYAISGPGTGGAQFAFSASIIFNGDGTAEISINGNSYTVDLRTGELI